MLNVVELIVDNDFMDVGQLKTAYLTGIRDFLTGYGYDVSHVDRTTGTALSRNCSWTPTLRGRSSARPWTSKIKN